MSDSIIFQCDLNTTDTTIPLGFEILLNDKSVYKCNHVIGPCQVTFDINDDDATQKLQFIMTGKTAEHTKLDHNNNIIKDALLEINNVTIDDVDITHILTELVEYTHDFNGTQDATREKFYGHMGCNGTVTLEFATPFYLWLLERM